MIKDIIEKVALMYVRNKKSTAKAVSKIKDKTLEKKVLIEEENAHEITDVLPVETKLYQRPAEHEEKTEKLHFIDYAKELIHTSYKSAKTYISEKIRDAGNKLDSALATLNDKCDSVTKSKAIMLDYFRMLPNMDDPRRTLYLQML